MTVLHSIFVDMRIESARIVFTQFDWLHSIFKEIMACSLKLALQIISIVACCYAIAISLYYAVAHTATEYVTCEVIVLLFSVFLILADIHVFEWMKYFSFVPTLWGRSLIFFMIGFFIYYAAETLALISSILFFILSMFYSIVFAIVGRGAVPLTQHNKPPEFSAALPDDFYEKREETANSQA